MGTQKLFWICLIMIGFSLNVQSKNDSVFVDKYNNWVKKEKAERYAKIIPENENSTRVEFYTMDGKLKSVGYYSVFKERSKEQVKHGMTRFLYLDGKDSLISFYSNNVKIAQEKEFYPDGQEKLAVQYSNNERNGLLMQYYPDGKLRRKEMYEKNVCLGGKLLDEEGNELPFYPYFVDPEFKGGAEALMKYLVSNIKYPVSCIRKGIQGRIVVAFVVNEDGTVSDVHATNNVHDLLDKESERIVAVMPKWIPGKVDGKEAKIDYILPVVFRLSPGFSNPSF